MIRYDSQVYSMQEAWATKTDRVSIRREVAWMDGWMDRDLTSGLEMLRRFSQGCRCRFCFSRWSLCGFWYDSLEFTCNLGYLMWASESEVSSTDGVLTYGSARFSWACLAVLDFAMRVSERLNCLFRKDSWRHLRPRWHKIAMSSWHHYGTRLGWEVDPMMTPQC